MPDNTPPTTRRNLCVLVVEDEFLIAMEIGYMLENQGYSVLGPAGSVAQALQMLETERPDAAVLDVNLRGELVTPVAERLHDLRIPFVVSSAYSSMSFSGNPVLMDAQLLVKPADEARLAQALDRVIG
ncbi:MAG: response regulator [Pararhodobacter sp.]